MSRGRKTVVPREIRRVATVAQRASSQRFVSVSDSMDYLADELVVSSPSDESQILTDSFTLSDQLLARLGISSELADSILIGDQFLLGFGASLSDSNSLSDSSETTLGLTIQVSDSFSLSDALDSYVVGDVMLTPSETLSQSDSLAIGYGLLLTDSNTLSDSFLVNAAQFLGLADFSFPPMTEDIIVIPFGVVFTVERGDFMEQFDAINLFSAGFKSFSEALSLSDAYAQRGDGFKSFSDSFSQLDSYSQILNQRLTFADNMGTLADGVASSGQIWDVGVTGEQATQTDTASVVNQSINIPITASDSINNLADAVIAKMPRWKDSISVVRNNAFTPVTQSVSDTLTSMSDVFSTSRVQFARPVSDISVGLWSATPLFNKIDETTIDDADLIVSATNPVNDTCECALTAATDPVSSVNHVLRYRYKKSASAGRQIDLVVRLMQGATIIVSFTHTNIGNTIVQADQTLTGTQADSITNYGDLRVRFVANAVGSGTGRAAHVTWALFECPK